MKTTSSETHTGLAGVTVTDSSICLCEAKGHALLYRGYPIEELAKNSSFEEVSWLLLRGEAPSERECTAYRQKLQSLRDLPPALKAILEVIPSDVHPMDLLRTGCSILGNVEPETGGGDPYTVPDRLIACMGSMLLYWWNFHETHEFTSLTTREKSLAGHILHLIQKKEPTQTHIACMNSTMILYAEHELNASTFTVRTIGSTLSDFYSAICGGIGALRGPLHGGANELALELIQKFSSPEKAKRGIRKMLSEKKLIMGFGHRVYTSHDPRSTLMKEWAYKLSEEAGDSTLFSVAEAIEEVMWEEKRLFPNLDFYSALTFYFMDIPQKLFTPIFAMSRITGWSAHLLEQREHNKLIRPLSHYIGPQKREWTPQQ